jgi:hypothetical protein
MEGGATVAILGTGAVERGASGIGALYLTELALTICRAFGQERKALPAAIFVIPFVADDEDIDELKDCCC